MSCQFYLPRKKRFCKMVPNSGCIFCPEHLNVINKSEQSSQAPQQTEILRSRVFCPLDNKHSCYEDQLVRHLKRCNAREKDKPVYYTHFINSVPKENTCNGKVNLVHIPDEDLMDFIAKINNIYEKLQVDVPDDTVEIHDYLDEETCFNMITSDIDLVGSNVKRHLVQNASIVSVLTEHSQTTNRKCCWIEFGAGRGQLSDSLIKCNFLKSEDSLLLVERASQRRKHDNKFPDVMKKAVLRIKIDIAHLNLGKLDFVQNCDFVAAIGKHLCGNATDLAIRCLEQMDKTRPGSVKTIAIALCCHHRCEWTDYVGKKWLLDTFGFDNKQFDLLCCLSSWATCGKRNLNTDVEVEVEVQSDEEPKQELNYNRYERLGLSYESREEIGCRVKTILNHGRIHYITHNLPFLKTTLRTYVNKSISPENILLLAR